MAGGLDGRVAVVNGAGRGIGRATAQRLARDGARVMAVARTAQELAALAREAPTVQWLAADVTVDADRIVAETRERLGAVEILVHKAGAGAAGQQPGGGQ